MVIPCEQLSFGLVKDSFCHQLLCVTHRIVGIFQVEALHDLTDHDVRLAAGDDVEPAAEKRMEEQGVLVGNAKLVGDVCPEPNHR